MSFNDRAEMSEAVLQVLHQPLPPACGCLLVQTLGGASKQEPEQGSQVAFIGAPSPALPVRSRGRLRLTGPHGRTAGSDRLLCEPILALVQIQQERALSYPHPERNGLTGLRQASSKIPPVFRSMLREPFARTVRRTWGGLIQIRQLPNPDMSRFSAHTTSV
jgi:hypothetical protein